MTLETFEPSRARLLVQTVNKRFKKRPWFVGARGSWEKQERGKPRTFVITVKPSADMDEIAREPRSFSARIDGRTIEIVLEFVTERWKNER